MARVKNITVSGSLFSALSISKIVNHSLLPKSKSGKDPSRKRDIIGDNSMEPGLSYSKFNDFAQISCGFICNPQLIGYLNTLNI